jgi:hypothetical protein
MKAIIKRQVATTPVPDAQNAEDRRIVPFSRTTIRLNHTREDAALICHRSSQILRGIEQASRITTRLNEEAVSLARILTSDLTITDRHPSNSSQDSQATELVNPSQSSQAQQSTQTSGTSVESCEVADFVVPGSERRITLETMRAIISMHDRRMKESSIRQQYSWYRRQYLERFRQCVERGGARRSMYRDVDEYVIGQVRETRERGRPVHDYMIRHWAARRAEAIGFDDFACSKNWLYFFKKRHGIRSKKVTKIVTAAGLS